MQHDKNSIKLESGDSGIPLAALAVNSKDHEGNLLL